MHAMCHVPDYHEWVPNRKCLFVHACVCIRMDRETACRVDMRCAAAWGEKLSSSSGIASHAASLSIICSFIRRGFAPFATVVQREGNASSRRLGSNPIAGTTYHHLSTTAAASRGLILSSRTGTAPRCNYFNRARVLLATLEHLRESNCRTE